MKGKNCDTQKKKLIGNTKPFRDSVEKKNVGFVQTPLGRRQLKRTYESGVKERAGLTLQVKSKEQRGGGSFEK